MLESDAASIGNYVLGEGDAIRCEDAIYAGLDDHILKFEASKIYCDGY